MNKKHRFVVAFPPEDISILDDISSTFKVSRASMLRTIVSERVANNKTAVVKEMGLRTDLFKKKTSNVVDQD